MKRKFIGLLALAAVGFAGSAQAYDFWSLVKDKTVVSVSTYSFGTGVTSTATILVDLSSTTVWPHKETRQINITGIRLIVDKAAAGTIGVRVGVVTYVDVSSGSVTWFWRTPSLLNVSNTAATQFTTGEWFYKCRVNPLVPISVADGATPYIISGDKTTLSTVYQTDVALPAPNLIGSVAPGVGDIVMDVTKGATAQSIAIEVMYHADN